jgi:hypothetical protein
MTAVLFTIGKFGLGWYLGRASTTSIYGAFGSLVALLLWVYYSAWILFFGAEFTRAYALAHGDGKRPEANAVKVTEEDKAKQGRPSEARVAAKVAQAEGRAAPRRVPPGRFDPVDGGGGKARQYAIAGAGVVVGAVAGALGAKSLMNDPSRPTRKHIQAVRLNERLDRLEQRVGRVSRIKRELEDVNCYERIKRVEQQIRHAHSASRSRENHRPGWLVRLGDAIAANK